MKFILPIWIIALCGAACVKVSSDGQSSNPAIPFDRATNPPAVVVPTPVSRLSKERQEKLADRTATKLEFGKMVKTNLGNYSRTVTKMFAFWEDENFTSTTLDNYAKRKEVYVTERDLNHDGTAEKIVFDALTKKDDGQSPPIAIFRLEGKTWKVIFGQSANIAADQNSIKRTASTIEFLSSGNVGDFDIIKVTEKTLTNEPKEIRKTVTYFQWKKDGFGGDGEIDSDMKEVYSMDSYEQFKFENHICRASERGKIDETLPCVEEIK